MAHGTAREQYDRLVERLNRHPQGAPPSPTLHRLLAMLFAPREAELVARLPLRTFTVDEAARRWRMPVPEAAAVLETLAGRALLLDLPRDGITYYLLPPPMAGFLEFALMRHRDDLDEAALAELYHQYINKEEEFARQLFAVGQTPVGRVLVNEGVLPVGDRVEILDDERATAVIRAAPVIGAGLCYCRHKMEHLGTRCGAPMDNCLTLGPCAASLIRHGFARRIEAAEALDRLAEARDRGLVQCGENVRNGVSFICNCCGCCCEALLAVKRFGVGQKALLPTRFAAVIDPAVCTGCGRCARACPVDAIEVNAVVSGKPGGRRRARVLADACLGCGVCVGACAAKALRLTERGRRPRVPVDTTRRVVAMALERGRLQDLLFDDRALLSHRIMAALLGAILRLPPVRRALAARILDSRCVEALIRRARLSQTEPPAAPRCGHGRAG